MTSHFPPNQDNSETLSLSAIFPFAQSTSSEGPPFKIKSLQWSAPSEQLTSAFEAFAEALREQGVATDNGGMTFRASVEPLDCRIRPSRYRDALLAEAYELTLAPDGICLRGATPLGVFRGMMSLVRAVASAPLLRAGIVTDWPELATRMIMLDPARQNENFGYYRHVIRWAARYGINAILVHLTDDQTSCLHHEDYPELMHPHAWTREDIHELRNFARFYHVELIPEIESFGHAHMFSRRADYTDFLHEDRGTTPRPDWAENPIAGHTNVLCPSSEKSLHYIDQMLGTAAESFDHPMLHLGFDEVDMTQCSRCENRFSGASRAEWFRRHLLACHALAAKHGRRSAFWGDMLLSNPEIMEGLPAEEITIFDWHYNSDVSSDSAELFKQLGFEVIASPSLVCYPRIILPSNENYANIRNFAAIARSSDLAGLNTTVWIPQRTMSDVLWVGLAYAGAMAWSAGGGPSSGDDVIIAQVGRDLFGLSDGVRFCETFKALSSLTLSLPELHLCAWADDDGLDKAAGNAASRAADDTVCCAKLDNVCNALEAMTTDVKREHDAFFALLHSAEIIRYALRHLQDAEKAKASDDSAVQKLDLCCIKIIGWIEDDWEKNRFSDDPNREGIHLPNQHLLHIFKQMHRYHQLLLARWKG